MKKNNWQMVGGLIIAAGVTAIGLAACGGDASSVPATSVQKTDGAAGMVHGGNNPVTGANIVAYAAGDGGAGTSATAVACVKTDSSGSFNFSTTAPTAACAAGTAGVATALPTNFVGCSGCPGTTSAEIYLVALGGNPGLAAGTNNAALTLVAALGPYSSLPATGVDINELTTVAATYSMAQLMGTSSATPTAVDQAVNASSPWLANAFSRAISLVAATSKPGTTLTGLTCTHSTNDPVNCGALEKLDSLANALATCANTSGSGSSGCAELFCDATPGATYNGAAGTCSMTAVPTDTLQAALSVAQHPGTVAISDLNSLGGAFSAFTPTLNAAPSDWTLAVNITDATNSNLQTPESIAIDASGNAWVTNMGNSSISEITPTGTFASATAFTGSSKVSSPFGIAVDTAGNIWATNEGGAGSVTELSSSGGLVGNYTLTGNSAPPQYIAIDSANHIWLTNTTAGSKVTELNSSGVEVSGTPSTAGGLATGASGLALDGNGRVWVPNSSGPFLSVLSNGGVVVANGGAVLGSPRSVNGLAKPEGIAFDPAGNAWLNDTTTNQLTEVNGSGVLVNSFSNIGLSSSAYNAVDSAGNVWVTNNGGNSITEVNNAGVALSPVSTGFTGGGLTSPQGIALDGDGDVWVTNVTGKSVTELIGAAAPVKTPLIGLPALPGLYPVVWLPDFVGNSNTTTMGGFVRVLLGTGASAKSVKLNLPAGCSPNSVAVNQGRLFVACNNSLNAAAGGTAPNIIVVYATLGIKNAATSGTSFSTVITPTPLLTMTSSAFNNSGGLLALAFDAQNNLWFTTYTGNEVDEIMSSQLGSATPSVLAGTTAPAYNSPSSGITFDTDGSLWATGFPASGIVVNIPTSQFGVYDGGNGPTATYCVSAGTPGCSQNSASLFPGGDPEGVAVFNGVLWVANNGNNSSGYELVPFTVHDGSTLNFPGAAAPATSLTPFGAAPTNTDNPFACPGGLFASSVHLWLNDEGYTDAVPSNCSESTESGVGGIFQFTESELPSLTAASASSTATPLLKNATGGIGFGGLYIEGDK